MVIDIIAFVVGVFVLCVFAFNIGAMLYRHSRPKPERPNYRRIWAMEHDLGMHEGDTVAACAACTSSDWGPSGLADTADGGYSAMASSVTVQGLSTAMRQSMLSLNEARAELGNGFIQIHTVGKVDPIIVDNRPQRPDPTERIRR